MKENVKVVINVPKSMMKSLLYLMADNDNASEIDKLQGAVDGAEEVELTDAELGEESKALKMGLAAAVIAKLNGKKP